MNAGETTEDRQLVVSGHSEGVDHQQHHQSGRARRRRRSTLGWLQTAMRMCDMGFRSVDSRCRRIDVDDGHIHVKIILTDQ